MNKQFDDIFFKEVIHNGFRFNCNFKKFISQRLLLFYSKFIYNGLIQLNLLFFIQAIL